jgi:hypothetical protein
MKKNVKNTGKTSSLPSGKFGSTSPIFMKFLITERFQVKINHIGILNFINFVWKYGNEQILFHVLK